MNALVLVARREIAEKKSWFWAALVAAILIVAIPHVAGAPSGSRAETTALIGWIFATIFAVSLAIHFGLSLFVGPSVERRVGFFFARPIPSFPLWAGKMLGGWIFSLLFCAILLAPALLASILGGVDPRRAIGGGGTFDPEGPWFLGAAALALLASIALFHLLAAAIRSGSPVAILDLVALAAGIGLLWWTASTMVGTVALDGLEPVGWGGAILVPLALLAAGLAQVASGRADLRRGHLAQSKVLWGILLPAAIVAALYARWYVSPSVADLRAARWVEPAPAGEWMTVLGPVEGRRGWQASFVLNGATGQEIENPPRLGAWIDPAFSADGRRAIWLTGTNPWETRRGKERAVAQMVLADLSGAKPVVTPVPYTVRADGNWSSLLLSADGTRFADLGARSVSVFTLPDVKLLGSFPLPAGVEPVRGRARFLSNEKLRLFASPAIPKGPEDKSPVSTYSLRIFDVDVAARSVTEVGSNPGPFVAPSYLGRLDGAGERMLIARRDEPRSVVLLDAATGASLATLADTSVGDGDRRASFLADGRVVLLEVSESTSAVRLYDRDGRLVREVALPKGGSGSLGGEPEPGVVWAAVSPAKFSPEQADYGQGWTLLRVDLEAGTSKEVGRDLAPLRFRANYTGGMFPPPAPGSAATRMAWTADGSLVRLTADGSIERVLVPGKGGRS